MPPGRRPGAGHPTEARQKAEAKVSADRVNELRLWILAGLKKYYAAMEDMALGLRVLKRFKLVGKEHDKYTLIGRGEDEEGEFWVYKREPDRQLLMFAVSLGVGRPGQQTTVEPETDIQVLVNFASAAAEAGLSPLEREAPPEADDADAE